MAECDQRGAGDRLVGRYRLRELIGAGDMGVVWRACDELLGRTVAVKRLGPAEPLTAEEARLRILREGRIAALLDHPRLLRVLDVVIDSRVPWLVLQYVEARTWASLWQEYGPVTPPAAAHVAAQVAEALAALHAGGVVHGDVTPENVLVNRDGEVKLADFGASRLIDDQPGLGPGRLTGVRDCLAPEVRSGRPGGTAADVYALGAAVHEAVEGVPPTGPPPAPRRAGALAPVLRRLLCPDPDGRPAAAQARAMLAAVASGEVSDR